MSKRLVLTFGLMMLVGFVISFPVSKLVIPADTSFLLKLTISVAIQIIPQYLVKLWCDAQFERAA